MITIRGQRLPETVFSQFSRGPGRRLGRSRLSRQSATGERANNASRRGLSVVDIVVTKQNLGKGNKEGVAVVTVRDDAGNLVVNATVTGDFSRSSEVDDKRPPEDSSFCSSMLPEQSRRELHH